jgi:tRNA A-37 threonylcarbamoyl transferase component Bud32
MSTNLPSLLKQELFKKGIVIDENLVPFRLTHFNEMYAPNSNFGGLIIKMAVHNGYISKMPFLDKDYITNEYLYFKALTNKSIPIPKILAFDNTQITIPHTYVVYKKNDGETLCSLVEEKKLSFEEINELYYKSGEVLKQLHSKQVNSFGLLKRYSPENVVTNQIKKQGSKSLSNIPILSTSDVVASDSIITSFPFNYSSWWDIYNNMVLNSLDSMKNNEYAVYTPKILNYLNKGLARFRDINITPTLIHGDFEPWNILTKNRDISVIIDGELSLS